tara:strand:- start:429 stop:695 length:267 start_codon:yes stop_codon:yes gene_type:complete
MSNCLIYNRKRGGGRGKKTKKRSFAKRTMKLGGKHHTKKRSKAKKKSGKKRPPSAWQKHLMKVFREMKSKDKSIKLGDAMREAKKSYK